MIMTSMAIITIGSVAVIRAGSMTHKRRAECKRTVHNARGPRPRDSQVLRGMHAVACILPQTKAGLPLNVEARHDHSRSRDEKKGLRHAED